MWIRLLPLSAKSPLLSFRKGDRLDELKITRWNTFDVEPATCQTSVPYIFAAGDSATAGPGGGRAIGGGSSAARSIDQFLRGKPATPQPNALLNKHIPTIFDSVDGNLSEEADPMPELPVAQRINNLNEVDLVISEADALYESGRCLSCCRLCYNADA
ncbi:MAG: hypothetical protein R2861_16505 [Desulfobacterales bacterium]